MLHIMNEGNLLIQKAKEEIWQKGRLVDRCFHGCVVMQHDIKLSHEERTCVERCVDRFIAYNQRQMPAFLQSLQNRMKEVQKEALEKMEKAKQEQANLNSNTAEQTNLQSQPGTNTGIPTSSSEAGPDLKTS